MSPTEWLLGNDTGISSKTICAVMTGNVLTRFRADVPHDPGDFGRCYRLLAIFPEWRDRMDEVAQQYQVWGPLVSAWDELTALYEEALQDESGKAPRLYDRLQGLIDEGRVAAGWTRTGPGSWRGPNTAVVNLGDVSITM